MSYVLYRGKHNGEITYIECIENDSMLLSGSTDGKLKCFSLASFTDDPLQTQTLHSFVFHVFEE